jgi:hypothetical protein
MGASARRGTEGQGAQGQLNPAGDRSSASRSFCWCGLRDDSLVDAAVVARAQTTLAAAVGMAVATKP